eukprot:XP_027304421.1 uncharacterized protein LOC101797923 isoform X1 [Anas platyrhynchos]
MNMGIWRAALRLWTVYKRLSNISTSMEVLTWMLLSRRMRKQRSSSSSMWTVLGMPVTDSLMDRDLYSVLKLELVLLVSMHANQWELKDSELQSGYREGTIMLFLTSQSMGA